MPAVFNAICLDAALQRVDNVQQDLSLVAAQPSCFENQNGQNLNGDYSSKGDAAQHALKATPEVVSGRSCRVLTSGSMGCEV